MASTQERGSLFWALLLPWLAGTSGVFHDRFLWTKTGGCTFHKSMGSCSCCLMLYISWDINLPTRSWIKGYIYTCLLPPVFIPSSFLHCFPPRHRMQHVHHFLFASFLRPVVGCLASVDPSWRGQCCLLQLRKWSSWCSELMGWFHAVLTSNCWNQPLCHRMNFQRLPLQPKLTHQKDSFRFHMGFHFCSARFPEISNTSV